MSRTASSPVRDTNRLVASTFTRFFAITAAVVLSACASPTAPRGDVSMACPSVPAATSSSGGPVPVTFESPTIKNGSNSSKATCTPASGSAFPLGNTTVTCGSSTNISQGASCTFTVTVQSAPRLTYTRFLAFGDSITEGKLSEPLQGNETLVEALNLLSPALRYAILEQRLVTDNPRAYPQQLQDRLRFRYQQQTIVVFNDGLGGEFTPDGLARLSGSLAATNPEVLLLMEGTNDMLNASGPTAAINALGQMITLATTQGRKVCIATIAPIRPADSLRSAQAARVPGYNDQVRALAQSRNVPLIEINGALSPDVPHYIGIDNIHPTERGYQVVADTFAERIRAAFEQSAAAGQTPK